MRLGLAGAAAQHPIAFEKITADGGIDAVEKIQAAQDAFVKAIDHPLFVASKIDIP